MKNIVLTGFMASGKSTIGAEISDISGMRLIDTDKMIETESKMTINEIFAKFGEGYFRDLESKAISKASKQKQVVISTGGGAVLRTENIEMLRKSGVVFNLEPSLATIRERLCDARSTRPLLADAEINEVFERFHSRKPYYDNCDCKIYVSNALSPRDFAIQILERMKTID